MKRRYKLLIIILVGSIITIIINSIKVTDKSYITAIGDGFSLGMTPYNVAGMSFNDYFVDKLEKTNNFDGYNNEFSKVDLTINELNNYLKDNTKGSSTKVPIKQTIAKSDIVTIAIGIDELAHKSLNQEISNLQIDEYLTDYASVLAQIRSFYQEKIIVLSLYPAYNFDKNDTIELNSRLKVICGKYNAFFIDVLAISLNKDYYLDNNSYYMNYKAHKKVAQLIYSMV